MKRWVLFLLGFPLFLAACSTAGTTEAAPTATSLAAFHASDPAQFVRAAGRPQLLEFFAHW